MEMGKIKMAKSKDGEIAYELHHSLDPIILKITNRILNQKSLNQSHKYFEFDLLNDTGIINLLRRNYLRDGNIAQIFEQYQNSRLDPQSYRFETIFTTLILSIVG